MSPMSPRLLRPRASGFDPRSIAGLELWLDFGDSSTVTLSGSTISQVNDKSGKGYFAVQGTGANQPTLTTNAINGKSVATFDGSNDQLTISSFPALTSATAFAVCYRNWNTNAYQAIASLNHAPSNGAGFFLSMGATEGDWAAGDMACFGNGFNAPRAPRVIGANSSLANGQSLVLSATLGASASGMWRNGSSIATRVNLAGAVNAASGTFRIGTTDFNNFWNGAIAEFLLYTTALSSTQIKSVERYLGAKYGIAIA